jgi:uncharacterized RDD family membrane protein YckC
MNKQLLQDLVEELKVRYVALTKMWKPYARVIWAISIPTVVYTFIINTGSLTLIVVGFIALACFLVFAPPFAGSYLLGLRVLALLADLLLVSFASFSVWIMYSDFQMEHQGQALMITLWVTFFYFVLFDWRFKGTLGKKLCRLRVVPTGSSKIDFWKSFLRVFVTFTLPIICGSYLQEEILGDGSSRIRFFLGNGLGDAVIFLIPMSIIFFGGNQSIADKILGVSVQRRRHRLKTTQNTWVLWVRRNTWALLICSTLACSFLLTAILDLGVWRMVTFGLPEKPLAKYFEQFRSVEDPSTIGILWILLPVGLKEPASIVRNIQMFDMSPNPFSFRVEDSRTTVPLNPEPYFAQLKQIRLVRVTLAPHVSSLVKHVVINNFLGLGTRLTSITQRPGFALLQLTSEQRFGVLYYKSEENILLCWMRSENNPIDFPVEVRPRVTYSFQLIGSMDEIRLLLLGHIDFVAGGI